MYANGAAVQPGPSGARGPTSFKVLRAVIEVQRNRGCEPAGASYDSTVATTKDSLPGGGGDAPADAQPGMVSLTISDDAVGGKPCAMDPCAPVHGSPNFVAHILQTYVGVPGRRQRCRKARANAPREIKHARATFVHARSRAHANSKPHKPRRP